MTRISWKDLGKLKEGLPVTIPERIPAELNKYTNSNMLVVGCVVGIGLHYLYTKLPDLDTVKSYFYDK